MIVTIERDTYGYLYVNPTDARTRRACRTRGSLGSRKDAIVVEPTDADSALVWIGATVEPGKLSRKSVDEGRFWTLFDEANGVQR